MTEASTTDTTTSSGPPTQRSGPYDAAAAAISHAWVHEAGVDVDAATMAALTKLRDAQEKRLAALNRTEMALRNATQPTVLPPPDPQAEPPALVDIAAPAQARRVARRGGHRGPRIDRPGVHPG